MPTQTRTARATYQYVPLADQDVRVRAQIQRLALDCRAAVALLYAHWIGRRGTRPGLR